MAIPLEECYGWAFQSEHDRSNLHLLVGLQEGLDALPVTAASFTIEAVTDRQAALYTEEMMWLVGSWEMPDRLSTARTTRWVNPSHEHKAYYFDVTVECECGAVMARERNKKSWDAEHNHTEECRPEYREPARDELIQKRKEWIRAGADLWLSYYEVGPRMGVAPQGLTGLCDRYGIDWHERRKRGRHRAIQTWRKLHDEYGHKWDAIAKAWGSPSTTVRSYARGHGRNVDA
jgi:hypothetical protein